MRNSTQLLGNAKKVFEVTPFLEFMTFFLHIAFCDHRTDAITRFCIYVFHFTPARN
jgi:hypothetical protein